MNSLPQYFKQLVVVPLQYFQQILGLTKGVPPQYLTPTHGSELEKLADFWCLWHRLHLEKQTFLYIVAKHKWIDKLPDTDRLERPKSKHTNQQTDRQTTGQKEWRNYYIQLYRLEIATLLHTVTDIRYHTVT